MLFLLSLAARPAPKPFLQHAELFDGMQLNATARTCNLSFQYVAPTGHTTHLSYNGTLRDRDAGNILLLDHLDSEFWIPESASIEAVDCDDAGLLLHVSAGANVAPLHKFLHPGALISGGRHWGCKLNGKRTSLQHKVKSRSVVTDRTLKVELEQAHLAEYFKDLKLRFHTQRYPKKRVHGNAPADPVVSNRRLLSNASSPHVGGWFSNALSAAWNGIKTIGSDVEKVVDATVHTIKDLVDGDLDASGEADTSFDWNFDSASSKAKVDNIEVDESVSCEGCFAHAELGVHLNLDIESHQVSLVEAYVEGKASASSGSKISSSGSAQSSYDKVVYTYTLDTPIVIFLGPVPVTIDLTVPFHVGYEMSADFQAAVEASYSASGDVKYGVKYDSSISDDLLPISVETFTHDGTLGDFYLDATANLVLYVMPVAIFEVEYIGGPTFGLKTFLEFDMDVGTEVECPSSEIPRVSEPLVEASAAAANRADDGAYKVTTNLGFHISVGAKIDIHIGDEHLYQKEFPEKGIWSKKVNIPQGTGCFEPGTNGRKMIAPHRHLYKERPQDTDNLVSGTTWEGTVTNQGGSCSDFPKLQQINLQITRVGFNDPQRGGDAFFIGSIHYADYDDDNTGQACVIQSGFSASWRPGGFQLLFEQDASSPDSSDYSACTKGPPDSSWINRFLGSWSGDGWSEIDAQDANGCMILKLYQTEFFHANGTKKKIKMPPPLII